MFELLLPSSEAAKAAVQAAKQLEALEAVRPAELFQRLGVPGCDASAAWPQAAAHDAAVTALQCVLAEAAGTQPPPGMTNVAGLDLMRPPCGRRCCKQRKTWILQWSCC